MKKVLVIGAGRSSTSLIDYLINFAKSDEVLITVGDLDIKLAKGKCKNIAHPIEFDVNNKNQREQEVKNADVVVSMLPAHMHRIIAKDCVRFNKDMVTASYVSDEINLLNENAKNANVLLLNEVGLDPGIDHMSAKKVIDNIKFAGGKIISFKSFTGGLIAPESDNNPWNYKFTWNPRNVVLAGQGVAQYIKNNRYKYIPYNKLFERTELINIPSFGKFEGYPNRDSLSYRKIYNLEKIPTILRGTLRKTGFCKAWNTFVQLGITDDTYCIEDSEHMTYRDFINLFLVFSSNKTVETKLKHSFPFINEDNILDKIKWLGLLDQDKIGIPNATPAQILQKKLEEKWSLSSDDKDMVVMQHQFIYELNSKLFELHSSFGLIGKNNITTAMSDTVGLPVGIATKLILQNKFTLRGVKRPVYAEIYKPILNELSELGIKFIEDKKEL